MKTRYPFQIKSIVHKSAGTTRTFGMDARLFSPPEESEVREPSAPLEMHEGYSVFKGTLIAKDAASKKYVAFNIPAPEVPYIHEKTKIAMKKNAERKLAPVEKSGEETPAYTVKITSGTLKGKTPAQILNESSANVSALEKQRNWLESNLSKYPANQKQIDAINEAIELFNTGKLGKATETLPVMEIYSCPPKNVKPLDKEGRWTIYDVSITYDFSKGLPVTVTVNNCFAPVKTDSGNEIEMSKAVDKKMLSMSLSEAEWFQMIDSMKAQKIMFESMTYPEQLKLAVKISQENQKNETK